MVKIAGVMYIEFVISKLPPISSSYHSIFPPSAVVVAIKVALLPAHVLIPCAAGADIIGNTVTDKGARALVQPFTVV